MTTTHRQADIASADPDDLAALYECIALITATDDHAVAEVRSGRLEAAYYPVKGLEAVCAALGSALAPTDQLVSTYRNMGDALAKGASLDALAAELYGRDNGVSHGKGGPMHLHDTSVGFMTTTGIVGSGLPIAVGLGLAAQLAEQDRIVAVTFGDGATSIGAYHEAMNMASLWQLPVIFVCQNNQWAEHTPIDQYAPSTDLAARAKSYSMATERVDGFDPLATRAAIRRAVDRARAGDGPSFVECMTYRLSGHAASTDHSYMPAEELASAMLRAPRHAFREQLVDTGAIDEQRLQQIDDDVRARVTAAFEHAQSSPPPSMDDSATDVYADTIPEVAR